MLLLGVSEEQFQRIQTIAQERLANAFPNDFYLIYTQLLVSALGFLGFYHVFQYMTYLAVGKLGFDPQVWALKLFTDPPEESTLWVSLPLPVVKHHLPAHTAPRAICCGARKKAPPYNRKTRESGECFWKCRKNRKNL